MQPRILHIQQKDFFKDLPGFLFFLSPQIELDHLEIVAPGVSQQPLHGIQLAQLQQGRYGLRVNLGDPLVNGDGPGQETICYILLREKMEAFQGFLVIPSAKVQVPHGIEGHQVRGVLLDNLVVFPDGGAEFALGHVFLRRLADFVFVESESKCHAEMLWRVFPLCVPATSRPESRSRSVCRCQPAARMLETDGKYWDSIGAKAGQMQAPRGRPLRSPRLALKFFLDSRGRPRYMYS